MKSVRIRLEAESFCNYTGPTGLMMSDTTFEYLCQKYGTVYISWYPVAASTIKCFDGQRWQYLKLAKVGG